MFIVWNPREFSRLYNLSPWYWNSLIQSHLLWGKFSTFFAANAIHNFQIFVPPGTHYCWVCRGSMEWEVCPTLLHTTSSGNQTPDLLIQRQHAIHLAKNSYSQSEHSKTLTNLPYISSVWPMLLRKLSEFSLILVHVGDLFKFCCRN